MVDFGPFDAETIRALIEAAKLGKSLQQNDSGTSAESHEARPRAGDDAESHASDVATSDINNPSIGQGANIGRLTVTNLYFSATSKELETVIQCCYDYPDGKCPHRS